MDMKSKFQNLKMVEQTFDPKFERFNSNLDVLASLDEELTGTETSKTALDNSTFQSLEDDNNYH